MLKNIRLTYAATVSCLAHDRLIGAVLPFPTGVPSVVMQPKSGTSLIAIFLNQVKK
jgi:hypothetical protein